MALATGTSRTGDTLVTWDDFAALCPTDDASLILARAAGGLTPERSRAALNSDLADYPSLQINSIAEWRAQITGTVNQLIAVIAALLVFAILIALIGIANTLSLSVLERTRESAIARALGLTRGQLRATLLVEAILMAVAGELVGIAFGMAYGWLTVRVMLAATEPLITVPFGELAVLLGVAALAAVAAAVLPARRAAKASVVEAMAEI